MDAGARNELDSIRHELGSIISELERVSKGIRNDFVGIGNDKCADCINKVVNQFCRVNKKLDAIALKGGNVSPGGGYGAFGGGGVGSR